MRYPALSFLIIFGFLGFTAVWSIAQVDIFMKIFPSEYKPVNIAIGHIIGESEITGTIRQVVYNDLNYSGYVKVQDMDDSTNTLGEQIDIVLEGKVEVDHGKINCHIELKETLTGWKIFSKNFSGTVGRERYLAHTISDEVVFRLTGENGIARTKIAFIKTLNGVKELAIADYDGGNQRVLTTLRALCFSPDWSPDAKFLVFSCLNPTSGSRLFNYNFSNDSWSQFLELKGSLTSPAFSPDGKKIAFTFTQKGNADIYVADANGKNIRRLTENPGIDTDPCWSPNGKFIAFTSDRGGTPQVYIMDADGGNVKRLSYKNNYNASPAWSPKGDLIAYVSQEDGRFQIYLTTPEGDEARCITDGVGNYENPSWAPDGLHIACASNRTGKWEIYTMLYDGSKLRRITFTGNNTQPAWSPVTIFSESK